MTYYPIVMGYKATYYVKNIEWINHYLNTTSHTNLSLWDAKTMFGENIVVAMEGIISNCLIDR